MKTKDRWKRSRTVVYRLAYHVIWCPKYRRKVLLGGVDDRLKELITQRATELDCKVLTL